MILKFKTESEWLAGRKPNINSTDLAALFGLSQYRSRLELWMIKAGLVQDDFLDTPFTDWGRYLQAPVGIKICQDMDWQGEDMTGLYMLDPELKIGSSMDVLATCLKMGKGLLEIKVAEKLPPEMGWTENRAPIEYEFQIQGQLHSAHKENQGIEWGAIGYLAQRQKSGVLMRKYDAELGKLIDEEVYKFNLSIQENKPPAPDYTVDGPLLEKLRGSLRMDDFINLSDSPRAVELCNQFLEEKEKKRVLDAQIKPIKERMDKIKFELFHMMKRNANAKIGDYLIKAPEITKEENYQPESVQRRLTITQRKRA